MATPVSIEAKPERLLPTRWTWCMYMMICDILAKRNGSLRIGADFGEVADGTETSAKLLVQCQELTQPTQ